MISRRNFFTIFLMMMILLFMFQFSMIIKENGNEYDTNEYHFDELPTSDSQWLGVEGMSASEFSDGEYVLYVGERDSAMTDMIAQWCTYTKRNVLMQTNLMAYSLQEGHYPEIILIDGARVDIESGLDTLCAAVDQGITVVFCSLPDAKTIQGNATLMELLGIEEVRAEETDIEGVRLFEGFLLGGEMVYKANTEEEKVQFQDFDLTVPWYITGKGTKTYMVGMKDEKEVEREKFPRLIWRNSMGNGVVFAVEGNFCDSLTGLGILDACVYESANYAVYPIVNAHNTIITDYPTMAKENEAEMQRIYSRSSEAVMRDIMWPGILSMLKKNDLVLTCYLQTKQNYEDSVEPTDKMLVFYLQQLKEAGAEAGRSYDYEGDITLQDKIDSDNEFYNQTRLDYKYSATYVKELSDELKEALQHRAMAEVRSITCRDRGDRPLLSYYTDNTTLLGVTNFVEEYTYTTDLEMRSLTTALGYSNLLIDMNCVVWPESEADEWQNYFNVVFSNVSTYFTRHNYFEQTAMSVTDARTRALLNTDYDITGDENVIFLNVDNVTDETYYLLRTHGQAINLVIGASYKKIAEDVYCLHVTDSHVKIALEQSKDVLNYDGPF